MMAVRWSFVQRKFILKRYWKCENVFQVQRLFKKLFQTGPPTRLVIPRIRYKFWNRWNCSGCPREALRKTRNSDNPHKSTKVGNVSPHSKNIRMASKLWYKYLKIAYLTNFEAIFNGKVTQHYEWYEAQRVGNVYFPTKLWSDEANFVMTVYHVNLPGVAFWCSINRIDWTFLFWHYCDLFRLSNL